MSASIYPPLTNTQLSTLPREARGGGLAARLVATLRLWRQRSRERAALAALDPRDLADFGASSADVYRALHAPFWRTLPPY